MLGHHNNIVLMHTRILLSFVALPGALGASSAASAVAATATAKGAAHVCYGSPDASCNLLFHECMSSSSLWSSPACLAAATCAGLEPFLEALCCSTGKCLDPAHEPDLDYHLYSDIVGSCAWAPGGCSMTLKDYVKFYYVTLLDAGSFNLPPVKTVLGWWSSIMAWTGTGSQCAYANLNNWLHHSSPAVEAHHSGAHAAAGLPSSTQGPNDHHDQHAQHGDYGQHAQAQFQQHPGSMAAGTDQDMLKNMFAAVQGNGSAHDAALMRRTASAAASGSSVSAAPKMHEYELPCGKYGSVCENWCYYVFCKKKGRDAHDKNWEVTVNRNANLRGDSACKTPNKCSATQKGTGGWTKNPTPNLSCDEQPKNTNDEGGANAATRCVPKGENAGEGTTWKNFINSKTNYISDGTKVKVVLKDAPAGGLCASLHSAGTTTCPAPVTPDDQDVKDGKDDGTRQA